MSDWLKFNAVLRDKRKKPQHAPPVFPVIVWGVTHDTALAKLVAEYPAKHYEIVSIDLALGGMHLSDPNSFKGAND